jgi:hypothetical protein
MPCRAFTLPKILSLKMAFSSNKNGIFKEGVLGSKNLHASSLHKFESTPQKANKLVKN